MTQTNKEREEYENFEAWLCTLNSFSPSELRFGFIAWQAAKQSQISQNEQQPKQIHDGWKPIETVPKDGTQVIIKCSGGRVATAFYDDKPFVGEGWHVVVPFLGGFGSGTDTFIYFSEDMPTHWMPLPEAPTTSLTSETNTEVGNDMV